MSAIKLMLVGDVMTGRGIDQIMPHPSAPMLFEGYVKSADRYVEMAERQNGAIPRRVSPEYVWGDALAVANGHRPDVRIANLETAVTRSDDPLPKGINYRMHPDNVACLKALDLDCCSVANNHVLDWGQEGLEETLRALAIAGIGTVGAGRDNTEAAAPAILKVGTTRVAVHAFACASSGVPWQWAATENQAGVNFIDDEDETAIDRMIEGFAVDERVTDIVVCSIHWGPNWGYTIERQHRRLAHALIQRGADIVVGHSSHHPKAIEVHRDHLILYGCGDFLNDYEGIGRHDGHRSDVAVMYLPEVDQADGRLLGLTMVPFEIRQFRLGRASAGARAWLQGELKRECARFGLSIEANGDGALQVRF